MNGTWYEFHVRHLINVPTMPRKTQNTENVAGYYQRILHQVYHTFIEMDHGHVPYIYLFGVLCSNACTKQRFVTSMSCENV